uniref:Putative zinc-finger domain-containing protein n=1 Tax=Anopheles farauti TaxID=69004 RepID=A0A182R1B2_9DIPT
MHQKCPRFFCTSATTMENPQQTIEKQQGGDLPEGLIFVSSGSEAPEEDEDHEEGEIQDEDDEGDLKQQDLEDISSDEESTIREQMAALEAMDKRVGMLKKLANRSSKHADYLDEEDDVVNGKENFYYYYQQTYKHHPSLAYRSRKVAAYKAPKEDNRHDSVTTKHPYTSHRPVVAKRHVKDVKSSKKSSSSHRRHKRRKYTSPGSPSPTVERRPESSDSEPEAVVDREYLKIACAIDNGKSQRVDGQLGERNPLRKKLFQGTHKSRKFRMRSDEMLAATTGVVNVIIDSTSNEEDDEGGVGEEEEELQLRLLALSTKPIVREAGLGEIMSDTFQIPSPPPPPSIGFKDAASDTVSAEEQELRLIALKTAVLKKHASRQKRRELDNERPYSPSDDIVLSPVRELPPTYDDGLYSDEREGSVELIDDDDVQIVEPHYEHIDLLDSDDEEEPEVGENDMEISPLGSPSDGSASGDVARQLIEEDSQQPVDMELASSDRSSNGPSPVYGGAGGGDSCDSALFHRRGDLVPASPSETPDSMEEAEAEALRHLLLTKMRQKRNRVQEVQAMEDNGAKTNVVLKEESVIMDVQCEQTQSEAYSPVPPPKEPDEQELMMEEESSDRTTADQPMQRKRRKKSHSNSTSFAEVIDSNQSAIETPPKPALVHTQKLVNNPNKLINLNRTAAPSPPIARTESPKDPAMVDTFVSRPVAKLIIQLGQSDSDSDVDFGSPSPQKPTSAASGDTASPGVRFEEQLEMFLKSVRSKSTSATNVTTEGDPKETDNLSERQEQPEQQVVTSGKSLNSVRQQQQQTHQLKSLVKKAVSSSTMVTPTAVKHLSKSAQLEYMRLVERMAQLERDKLARQNAARTSTAINSEKSISKHPPHGQQQASSSLPAVDQHRTDQRFGKSPGRRKQSQSQEAIAEPAPLLDPVERKLQQIRSSIPNLSEASRNRLLHTAERHLEKHSESFVNELEQHNAIILDAQKARRELYHLESRIDLLREKLSMLERARERHRHRSFEKFTSLQVTRAKVLSSRKRSGELERMCYQIGRAIKGETYQLPTTTSSEMVQEQLRILVAGTQQLRSIRKPSLEQFKEEMIANHKRRLATCQEAPLQAEPEEPVQQEDEESVVQVVVEHEGGSKLDDVQHEREESKVESTTTISEEDPVSETVEAVPNEATDEMPSMEKHVEEQPVSSVNEPIAPPGFSAPDVPVTKQITATEPPSHVEVTEADQSGGETETITLVPSDAIGQQTNDPPIRNDTGPHGTEFRIEKYTSPLMSLKQGAQNIPTGILCPYELGGQCVDRDCKFEHFAQRTA